MDRKRLVIGGLVAVTTALVGTAVFAATGGTPACGCAEEPRLATTTSTSTDGPVDPAPPPGGGVITVTGSGTVSVDPDTAVVNLGAQATATTGAEALDQVNAATAALTEALVAVGVAEEDIQTAGINLYSTTDDRGEVNGYQASINVSVTVRDIGAVGPTIDASQQAAGAAFTIGGVSFSFADPESVLEPARLDAVAHARGKAEQYAAAAGVTLGSVVAITEGSAVPPVLYSSAGDMAVPEAAAATPISPGQLDLSVDVSVTFSITS